MCRKTLLQPSSESVVCPRSASLEWPVCFFVCFVAVHKLCFVSVFVLGCQGTSPAKDATCTARKWVRTVPWTWKPRRSWRSIASLSREGGQWGIVMRSKHCTHKNGWGLFLTLFPRCVHLYACCSNELHGHEIVIQWLAMWPSWMASLYMARVHWSTELAG